MNIGDLMPAIIAVLLGALLLGIGMLILFDFGDQVARQIPVDNDSFTPINGTWVDLSHDYFVSDPTICQNRTGGETIATTNYEVNQTDGAIRQIINGTMGNGSAYDDVVCDYYYYDYNSSPYRPVYNTATALQDFSSWFSIMVIVAAASIIIGLIVRSFRN